MAKELAVAKKINTKGFALSRKKEVEEYSSISRMVKSDGTKAGDVVFIFICVVIGLICIIPMINLLARSLSASDFLVKREVYLLPKGINLSAYTTVLGDPKYIKSFVWTVILTVICTFLSLKIHHNTA